MSEEQYATREELDKIKKQLEGDLLKTEKEQERDLFKAIKQLEKNLLTKKEFYEYMDALNWKSRKGICL